MKLVIAATGASGTIYLQRLLDQIDPRANEVHRVMSGHAKQVAAQEIDTLTIPASVMKHPENDLNVPYVSGSARFAIPTDPRNALHAVIPSQRRRRGTSQPRGKVPRHRVVIHNVTTSGSAPREAECHS